MNDRERVSVLEGLLARVRENAQQERPMSTPPPAAAYADASPTDGAADASHGVSRHAASNGEPVHAEPSYAEPSYAEPSYREPSYREPPQVAPPVERPKLISFDSIGMDDLDVANGDGAASGYGAVTQRSVEPAAPAPMTRPRLELSRGPSEPPPTKPLLQLDDAALDEELVGSTPPPPLRESSEPAWAPPRFTRPPTLPPPPALVMQPPPPALVMQPPPPPALVMQPPPPPSPPSMFDEVTMTGDPDEAEAMILREREAALESEGAAEGTTQRPLPSDEVPGVSVTAQEPLSLDDLDVELYSEPPPPPAVVVNYVVPVDAGPVEGAALASSLGAESARTEAESSAMHPDELDEIERAALRASLLPEEPVPESARKLAEVRPVDEHVEGFDERAEEEPPPESGPVPSVPPEVRAGRSSDWSIHRPLSEVEDFDDAPLDQSAENAVPLGVDVDDAPTPRPFDHLGVSHAATPPDGTPIAQPYYGHDDLGDATAEVRSLGRVDIVERAPVIERDSVAVFSGTRDPETFGEVLDEALSF